MKKVRLNNKEIKKLFKFMADNNLSNYQHKIEDNIIKINVPKYIQNKCPFPHWVVTLVLALWVSIVYFTKSVYASEKIYVGVFLILALFGADWMLKEIWKNSFYKERSINIIHNSSKEKYYDSNEVK